MEEHKAHPFMQRIAQQRETLTPKGRLVGDYILEHPRKAVFMTTRELATACGVSEATVVRFVNQLGWIGFSEFIQALRDMVDTEMTLLERVDLSNRIEPGAERFRRVVFEEIDNLKLLFENINLDTVDRVLEHIHESPRVYVIGSRVSYTLAYYMGWSLTKVRKDIRILKGSDSITIDWLTFAPAGSLVLIFATSRYLNELVRVCKLVRRQELTLVVFSDSALCPLNQFAHLNLIAPSRYIPMIGNPTPLMCLINYLVQELAGRYDLQIKTHQEKLEQSYRENDIFFNPHMDETARLANDANEWRNHLK